MNIDKIRADVADALSGLKGRREYLAISKAFSAMLDEMESAQGTKAKPVLTKTKSSEVK